MASGRVLARVIVVKSANLIFTLTVRPANPAVRNRPAVRSASRSSSRRTTSGSSTSRPNVSSAPMLLSGSCGTTLRSSRPHDRACRCEPVACPRARTKVCAGVCAMSPTVCSPSRVSSFSVFSPTPHSAPTGSGCRNATTPAAGTTSRPSGLLRVEASLATNFVDAMPTEQVMPCSSATRSRISWPITAGRPSRRTAPETSRKASSRDNGSTIGVIDRKISITPAETVE